MSVHQLLTTLLLLAGLSPALAAHGGQYAAPSDAGTFGGGSGGTVAPPTNPGGNASTAAGAGATSSGIRGPGRTGGRTGNPRDPKGRDAAGTGSDSRGLDSAGWALWWTNNRHRFLGLNSRLVRRAPTTSSATALTGRGKRTLRAASYRPDRPTVNEEILPTLLGLLDSSSEADILDSSVLAAARSSDELTHDEVFEAILPHLGDSVLSVRSASTLALGALGNPDAIPVLVSLLRNDARGKQLVGNGQVHILSRSFAALSLGMIGPAVDETLLMNIVDETTAVENEVRVCTVIGLGLLAAGYEEGAPTRDEIRQYLEGLLAEKRTDRRLQAHAATALGRIGDPSALDVLLLAFRDRDTDNAVRRAAAIGLGRLATTAHGEVVDDLLAYVDQGRDRITRRFGLIALGEIGARGAHDRDTERREKILARLGKEIDGRGKRELRSWAALAAALYARADDEPRSVDDLAARDGARERTLDHLRRAYEKERDPAFKSAFAIALGLLGDEASADVLEADLREQRDDDLLGHLAVSLGLLDHAPSAGRMRQLATSRTTAPHLRTEAALGLGLLGDRASVQDLVTALEDAPTLGVIAGVATALGLVGDRLAVEPLRELALSERQGAIPRAFACVALGLLGEKTPMPFQAEILGGEDYLTESMALAEIMDIP